MEALEQSRDSSPESSSFQTPFDNFNSSILYLTNPQSQISDMQLALKSIREVNGKFVPLGKPLLNDYGINQITGLVQSWVNQCSIMSNFKEKWVYMNTLSFADVVIADLMINRFRYEITDPMARSKIVNIATNYVYSAQMRASEEGERRFWKGSQHEITTKTSEMAKGNFLSSLMGWVKKGG